MLFRKYQEGVVLVIEAVDRNGGLEALASIRSLIFLIVLGAEVWVLPAAAVGSPSNHDLTGDVHVSGSLAGVPPKLVFASDGTTTELTSLLSQPGVITDLRRLKAGIALALPDFTTQRADTVRQLNDAGIPVTAWLTLPEKEGYYLNAGNEPKAAARFAGFEHWTAEQGLH
jgi:hypothetical protein